MESDVFKKQYALNGNGPIRYKDRQILDDIAEWFFNQTVIHQDDGGLPLLLEVEIRLQRNIVMSEPKVIQIGNDPSPEWNDVRQWLAEHYANAETMAAIKEEDDALDAVFLDLIQRWYLDAPDADCFEIGVDEKVGTVRLRLARRDTKPAVDLGKFIQALLEAGVSPGVIGDAQQKAMVEGKQGKAFPRFDKVLDSRDRGKPKLELVK